MKILVVGATGAIGGRLVSLLVHAGHEVVGSTRTSAKHQSIRVAGAEPVLMDVLNATSVAQVFEKVRPEVVIHQATAIPAHLNVRKFDRDFAITNRLRTEGTDNLLAAARNSGVRRFIAQSFAGWPFARVGGLIKSEEDPLDQNPPEGLRRTLEAPLHLERAVLSAGLDGVVLRYGGFYGPGTSISESGSVCEDVRKRRFPLVGTSSGVWSFVHIEDAAVATFKAIGRGSPGVYNIVDDDPAPVSEWLPGLAAAIGAKPPFRIPAFLGRLLIGDHGLVLLTESRGASNEKAKRELGWNPRWRSWREGFRYGLKANGPSNISTSTADS